MVLLERGPQENGRAYALRMLRKNIISMELKPGTRLSENELAKEMNLSRTPVREALIELSRSKIVEIYPHWGSTIAPIDRQLVQETQFLWETIECAVAERCCARDMAEWLPKLEESLDLQEASSEAQNWDQLTEERNWFYRCLFRAADVRHLYELVQDVGIHFWRVRSILLWKGGENNRALIQDSRELLRAICAHDAPGARALVNRRYEHYWADMQKLSLEYPGYFK